MFDKRGIDKLHDIEECAGGGKNQKREGGCEYQYQISNIMSNVPIHGARVSEESHYASTVSDGTSGRKSTDSHHLR